MKSNAGAAAGRLFGGVEYKIALTTGMSAGAVPAGPWMDALGRLNTAATLNGTVGKSSTHMIFRAAQK